MSSSAVAVEDPTALRRPIAVTPGEPAGIGPDLVLGLALQTSLDIVAIADPGLLRERASILDLPIRVEELVHGRFEPADGRRLPVMPVTLSQPARCGRLDVRNSPYVLETLRRAVTGCMAGEFAALVTGPVHKGVINDAGIPFSGHTEFLAELSGTATPVMMLATPTLRVALATTHLPLREVSAAISDERLESVIRVLVLDLRSRFGIPRPRVTVCGLNPHAGEGGHLGREEIEVIQPTVERLRAEGLDLVGPLPADTAFTPSLLAGTDAVLAMYHDQGLPVLKHSGFGHAVNITLGLPFVRTSVDHGTALDLAGSGKADGGSLAEALQMAARLVGR